jgi:8-oxo-dGTP pyrophosphatase MutT (NUDIX family)
MVFDPNAANDVKNRKGPAVRPRDAATLILMRKAGPTVELLMGQRHSGHRFMPNQFVFPGGRVDRADQFVRPGTSLRPEVAERLSRGCSPSRAQALALAAIRETFEETGLILGHPLASGEKPPRTSSSAWAEFFATGHLPALDKLDYVARAITPPYRPMRFHARFFLADASLARGEIKGSGELLKLHWVPIGDAKKLDLPRITAVVIDEIDKLASGRPDPQGVPFFFFKHNKPQQGWD